MRRSIVEKTSNLGHSGSLPLRGDTKQEAMAAFDSLPQPIRERLANAKFPISPVDALIIYQRNGLEFTLRQIAVTEQTIERKSPYEPGI